MKVATAAYTPEWLPSRADYEDKIARWVSEAAGAGAELLVFPEYGAMELAAQAGEGPAGDAAGSIRAVSERMSAAVALHAALAREHGVHILMASGPVIEEDSVLNRAYLCAPGGEVEHQDKQIMTRFERAPWGISGGGPLKVFDTDIGRIGVLICYDSEFPLLARTMGEAGAEILLVPSCTEKLEGYWRVRIGAMARALETQCVSVMASLTGGDERLYCVEENRGAGGIFGPPDRGFPSTGVIAEGALDEAGWTYGDIDLAAIREVRADGNVLNRAHWPEQAAMIPRIRQVKLG